MKTLYIGDLHAKPDCLDDVQALIDYALDIVIREKIPYVCFLGDQTHTHSILHLSVMAFWKEAFEKLTEYAEVYVLVGNHDKSGRQDDPAHALMLYKLDGLTIVDTLVEAPWGALLAPYYADPLQLRQGATDAYKPSQRLLVCHQTFNGSKYENGFYAHDGVDPKDFRHDFIISGHIHTPQEFHKVWYPGSPRWQTASDANTARAIWVVDHARDGTPLTKTPFWTDSVCKAIHLLKDTETEPADITQISGTIIVDVHGSEAYIKARRKQLEAQGARVRAFPESKKAVKVKESDGAAVALRKYIQAFKPKHGTPTEILMEMAEKRLNLIRV